MMGTLIRARISPPFSTFKPIGVWKSLMITGFITVKPTKPQTTEGMAASSSMVTLSDSLARGPQNSEMKIAAPIPNGTANAMASAVTLTVPAISASTP